MKEKTLNDEIEINGKKYIKKDSVKIQKDYMIKEPIDVCAIVPVLEEDLDKDIIEVEGFGTFKKFEEGIKFSKIDETLTPEVFELGDTKFSFEFLEKMKKTAKPLFGNTLEFYKWWEGEFKEDNPCLIKFGNLVFALAPRIEE